MRALGAISAIKYEFFPPRRVGSWRIIARSGQNFRPTGKFPRDLRALALGEKRRRARVRSHRIKSFFKFSESDFGRPLAGRATLFRQMSRNTAIITGISGQDGQYLARHLLENGYRVVGTTRAAGRHQGHLDPAIELVDLDIEDDDAIVALLQRVRPSEVYNLAAHSSGSGMFDDPVGIGNINGVAVTRLLEAIRTVDPTIRFLQASSSEMFGEPTVSPQTEETPFCPRSPYGAAKLYAHAMVGVYRRQYGLFASSAILFNHESPLRGDRFVTGKVARGAAMIKLGRADHLVLGDLDARRDWGFSGDYMRGAWLMLQAPAADDFVFATGKTHAVRDVCETAFAHLGLDYRLHVRADPTSFRPLEARSIVGDASKAARLLNWTPRVAFADLVKMMVDTELERLSLDQERVS